MRGSKQVVGYVRISSQEGRDTGSSLRHQKERIEQYCKYKGLPAPTILSDEAVSGFYTNKRKSFLELLRMVEDGEVSHLIINDLSRLSRNLKDLLSAVDLMEKKGVVFVSLSEEVCTNTSTGKFFLSVIGAFSQLLRDQVSDKMKATIRQNRSQGRHGPGFTPFGMRVDGKSIVLDEAESKIIGLMLELHSKGFGYTHIAEELNARRIKPRRGKMWFGKTVANILQRHERKVA